MGEDIAVILKCCNLHLLSWRAFHWLSTEKWKLVFAKYISNRFLTLDKSFLHKFFILFFSKCFSFSYCFSHWNIDDIVCVKDQKILAFLQKWVAHLNKHCNCWAEFDAWCLGHLESCSPEQAETVVQHFAENSAWMIHQMRTSFQTYFTHNLCCSCQVHCITNHGHKLY